MFEHYARQELESGNGNASEEYWYETPAELEAFHKIIERNNEIHEIIFHDSGGKLDIEADSKLEITTGENGNLLNLGKYGHSNTIPIGYYSPAYAEFVTYPELVDIAEIPIVLARGYESRQKNIDKFNSASQAPDKRIDYDHPLIQQLHYANNVTLHNSPELDQILDDYNSMSDRRDRDIINIDQSTHISVTLGSRKFDGDSSPSPEHHLWLSFQGAFYSRAGAKRRHNTQTILLAVRDKNTQELDFRPANGIKLDKSDLDIFIGLAAMALDVKDQIEGFNTSALGRLIGPDQTPRLTLGG